MKTVEFTSAVTRLGLAHGPGITEFLDLHPDSIDYVEMPFEQLRHNPALGEIQERLPILLHCASMSVAGFIPPSQETLDAMQQQTERTATPWIGEHLAFVSADGIHEEGDRDTAPTNLTYTVCPQLSEASAERVALNLAALRSHFATPIILENSPQYFFIPGSTMNMSSFISAVVRHSDVDLLLDLSHFMITSRNMEGEAFREIEELPLERVVEIHLSGMSLQEGIVWDDHAVPAPPEMFTLLQQVMRRAKPRAVTLEYNWEALPDELILSHIEQVNEIVGRA
jgi:uncharacterized protein (UPF0276 family)